MIIHQPEIANKDGQAILFNRFEWDREPANFPRHIWFRLPEQYGKYFSTNNDAFLVAGLLAGMYYKENVEVRGAVSPRLAYQLEEYKFLLKFRFPKLLEEVEIKYDRLESVPGVHRGVGTTFSGGVDSLFTLLKNLPQNQPNPDYQVTHGLFVHGFDLSRSQIKYYNYLLEEFQAQVSRIGIELIPLSTNLVSVTHQRLSRLPFTGSLVATTALSLSGLFHRFYSPSNYTYQHLLHQSTTDDPQMGRLLSTDTLEIIIHGASFPRVDKVREIADWDVAQKVLSVCWSFKAQFEPGNCSRCEKCMRTMIPLYALGKLDRFTTFKKPFKSNRDVLLWARKYSPKGDYEPDILKFVKKNKPGLLPWVITAAIFGTIRWLFTRFVPKSLAKRLRRFGYYPQSPGAPDAYEVPEVTSFLQGQSHHDHPSA